MILVNGHETGHIAVNDRGFQYGDGLFETIEVLDGRPVFLALHLQRLNDGCNKLKIPCPCLQQLEAEIGRLCKHEQSAVLKIIVTRGTGGRGYRQPEKIEPTRVLSLFPYPHYPVAYYKEGITTLFCNTRLGINPTLAGIKHLNRLEQVMARSEWENFDDIQEGLMLDINDYVIEGTMTNLFYVKDSIVYTALLENTGVAGITRAILKGLLLGKGVKFIEHNFYKENLFAADEAFVCNSVIGIWPVKQVENVKFEIGRVTKQLQGWLSGIKHSQSAYEA